ncbi:prolipoprotein diacylglyceryl transferase [Roseococcus suduntuyensis]|uniref:Phosphatidylglycerol--prolipoprotein diacylglyceryl transferase n=1 Tax=Roseococcus suduntuyensis TaxID=455361 RepID=A0A840ADJ5_9PROT|nr:prolipoprotein diacylglyceryl transferase [Roseococcus suduntuyensis]MBB3898616.1 phosphatidylglycerol:prolipoprotein diacylglycerol transferase [Roseococcus suduntuyensis]
MIPFPQIDPVALQIGPIGIRWYALAYIAGIVIGWRVARRLVEAAPAAGTARQMDDFVTWATLGIIIGGRLGYVLFYRPAYYLQNPLEALMVWQGGMAFHGGALGVIVAALLFCRAEKLNPLAFGDRVAVVVPIGLFFGRIANFINGELWGRPASVPWAMVFPHDPLQLPRHPSQLYQAGLEGVALFLVMLALWSVRANRARPGLLTGTLIAGYGVARSIGEFFRQPDDNLGFLLAGSTMGQLLSLPMILVGLFLILRARRAG